MHSKHTSRLISCAECIQTHNALLCGTTNTQNRILTYGMQIHNRIPPRIICRQTNTHERHWQFRLYCRRIFVPHKPRILYDKCRMYANHIIYHIFYALCRDCCFSGVWQDCREYCFACDGIISVSIPVVGINIRLSSLGVMRKMRIRMISRCMRRCVCDSEWLLCGNSALKSCLLANNTPRSGFDQQHSIAFDCVIPTK